MRRHHMLVYAIAFAVVAGLVFTDLSASTVLLALLVLACPLMMFVMMRGMHGDRDEPPGRTGHDRDPAGPGTK